MIELVLSFLRDEWLSTSWVELATHVASRAIAPTSGTVLTSVKNDLEMKLVPGIDWKQLL